MTANNLVNHEIYAGNYLLGDSQFLTLNLPPEWQIAQGVSRPDIVANHERRNKMWVANGKGWYVVYDGERRWAMEMAISIKSIPKTTHLTQVQSIFLNGHTADINWKSRRRGLPWRRHDVKFMTVDFDCQYTDRHLQLEFSGWCPQEGFDEILEALTHLRCH